MSNSVFINIRTRRKKAATDRSRTIEVALDGIAAAPQGAVVPHRYKWINHCAPVYSILPLQIIRIIKGWEETCVLLLSPRKIF